MFNRLIPLIRLVARRPGVVLALGVVLAAVGAWSAQGLRIDTDLANLLPRSYPSVQALDRLRDEVGAEQPVDVAIQSPSFEANRQFAEALIPPALALRDSAEAEPFFRAVDYRRNVGFLRRNALYFATSAELDSLEAFLREEAENARYEANPFFFDPLEDPDAEPEADDSGSRADDLQANLAALSLSEYPVSEDSTTLVLRFTPTGAQTDLSFIRATYGALDSLVASLQPASFHPEMEVVTAGRLYRQLVEVETVTDDVGQSFAAGVLAILVLVVGYFFYKGVATRRTWGAVVREIGRAPVNAFVIAVPLGMSLLWTGGIAAQIYGSLNLMTSTLGLVLFGLGIDYGIHFYARYLEERREGHAPTESLERTFVSGGPAIAVSAVTTASALAVLVIADFRGFSEFGLLGSLGIVFALVAMLIQLPALLMLVERIPGVRPRPRPVRAERGIPPKRHLGLARATLGISALATVLAVVLIPRIEFEYDFNRLEPVFERYEERAEPVRAVYDDWSARRNPAFILVDDPAEVPPILDTLAVRAQSDTLILAIESLQGRVAEDNVAAQERLVRLDTIRALLNDPFLRADTTGQLDRLRAAASTTAPLSRDSIPEQLRRAYRTKTGEEGRFVLVYANGSLADNRISQRFTALVGQIETPQGAYQAASTSIIAADMVRLLLDESPLMVTLSLLMVALLLIGSQRSLKWGLLALVPLAVGVLWMLGVAVLVGLKLSFYNIVVLPAVLGIGCDAGAHLIHRYREEGPGSIRRVLRSSGEHVAMGGLTTMIGFAGLWLSFHPGLSSIGQLAVVGIGATLVTALVFLPALLRVLEARLFPEAEDTSEQVGANGRSGG